MVDGDTLTLTYRQELQTIPKTDLTGASAPGKSPVYLAVVSEPWERRRTIAARPPSAFEVNGMEVKGRQVKLTLDPPAGYNQKARHRDRQEPRATRIAGERQCREVRQLLEDAVRQRLQVLVLQASTSRSLRWA